MKKYLTRIFALLLSLFILFALSGCKSSSDKGSSSDITGTTDTDDSTGIGVNVSVSDTQGSAGAAEGTGDSGNSASGATNAGNPKAPSTAKGSTVEICNWNPITEYPQMSDLKAKFEKKTGITIKWTVASYENYCVEIASRVAADNAPDIIRFKFMNVAEMELAQPLKNSRYNFNTDKWDKQVLDYYTVNGKAYAANTANSLINSPFLMTYNRDIIAMYDYEDPYTLWKNGKWTWDKLMEMCEDYNKDTGNAGMIIYTYDSWCRLNGYQGILSFKDGRYGSNIHDTKFQQLLSQANNYKSTGIQKTWDYDGFNSGKYPFMENMAIHLRRANPYFAGLKGEAKLGVVPYPTIEGASTVYTPIGELEAYGFAKGAKNIEAAPYVLEYLLDANNYDESTYFYSAEALEVYKYVMAQPNRVVHTRYPDGKFNKSDIDNIHGGFDGKALSQITTYAAKVKDTLNTYISNLNNRLSKLK